MSETVTFLKPSNRRFAFRMPRRPSDNLKQVLDQQMRTHVAACSCDWMIGEMVIPSGPDMAELVGRVLPIRSDSRQRQIANQLASADFVTSMEGRRVTVVNSATHWLLNDYSESVRNGKALAGSAPPKPGSNPRGRPRIVDFDESDD